ncbi:hypothetical protein M8371_04770, partial [Klebsiella pneumoniae]|nr:hypothetical protein [Klebsiella pneumoniae]
MYQDLIRNELNEAAETLANFLQDEANIHAIQRAAVLLADSFKAGGKVLSCGNGGVPLGLGGSCRERVAHGSRQSTRCPGQPGPHRRHPP